MFRRKSCYTIKEIRDDIKEIYSIKVSKWMCYRGNNRDLCILKGSLEAHYGKLHSYHAELKRFDKEVTFELVTEYPRSDGRPVFKRFYVGFFAFCRSILCVDGCFLKTVTSGALLSAIARDGNDQMYPIS